MKASRLLSIVLLLQAHERMTTRQLAARFEVSQRTILRDVDALSAAGVPVHAERGRNGAIVLDRRARLDLSRLEPAELQLLAALGLDTGRLEQVGLGDVGARARDKLDAAARRVPAPTQLAEVLLIDPLGWFTDSPGSDLADLLTAARDRRRLTIRYRHSGRPTSHSYVVDPYGLAGKGSSWYLVGDVEGRPRMFNASRIESYDVLDDTARWRPGETLQSVWSVLLRQFSTDGARVEVQARLRASRLDLARRILGTRLVTASTPHHGWVVITVAYPEVEAVRQLLQFGDHIQVLNPPEAVQRIDDLATDLSQAHRPAASICADAQRP